MRIAQIAPLWASVPPSHYGGTEAIVHLLTEELVRRGHEVTLFASGDSRTDGRLRPACDVNLIDAMARGEAWTYEGYANANLVEALREAESFDIIHCHLGCRAIPIGTLSRTPIFHRINSALTPDDLWILSRYPDVPIIAQTHSQIASVPPARRQNIRIIYNGVNVNAYEPSYLPGKYLAFLGRMSPLKNPLGAIQIAGKASLPIVLAGAPENLEEEDYFSAHIRPRIDGKHVTYIGRVAHAQKNELLKNAAALLFPIEWEEPFGNVMVEAMACGTPVLACNRGAVSEVIDYGKTGFYGDSPESVASFVPRTLELDRAAIRAHAQKRFSHIRMVDQYLQTYEDFTGIAASLACSA
ncbi:MAG: glycosyltransferase family 4 protein [Candidatus Tectomicrobia bacterium]|uniref:Glycosyltransferase family 4 protein n=1 Tax=Tectimicrobiota bacterium TaxID=2528274 RepID=A0A932HXK0_UNCTE|nr:glycosyltransferase family 4 protein [Candidatus Tectomicrobia bacterium]